MIIHFDLNITPVLLNEFINVNKSLSFKSNDIVVVITSSSIKQVDKKYHKYVKNTFSFDSDIQLAHKSYVNRREVFLGKDLVIGGDTGNTVIVAGPCSVESENQIHKTGQFLAGLGVNVLRGGCYKPRTSPYSFQGLGLEGLKLLNKTKAETNQLVITEARDATHIAEVIEHTDIIQIGAKAMYDHGILKACSQISKPVMLKRGFGTTLQEFVQAAEFILSGGNENVILCERGIRTFETKTRFTLDLCGVSFLKEYTNLPVILDPSHALGYAYGVPDLTRACIAMGVDGVIIEVHPNPKVAKSDASQQLNFEEFKDLYSSMKAVASSIERKII